jgi:hypothetical protein
MLLIPNLTINTINWLFPMQRAVELEKKDVGGKSDPYCLIQYSDQKYQTKVNPVSHIG